MINNENGRLYPSLIEYAAKINKPTLKDDVLVRVDILKDEKNIMLILQNKEEIEVRSQVEVKYDKELELTEQFSGEKIKLKSCNDGVSCDFYLKAREVKVYCG